VIILFELNRKKEIALSDNDDELKRRIEQGDVYKGNSIPKVIKLMWILFIIWGVIYSITFVIPDLKVWLAK